MSTSEIYNQTRMQHCGKICGQIMVNWQRTKTLSYTVRATESLEGQSLCDLRTKYFVVGVGEELTEVPFNDVLVIFSMMREQLKALKELTPAQKARGSGTLNYRICTSFTDDEAAELLSGIRIETPFDSGETMRIVPTVVERDEPEGDQA